MPHVQLVVDDEPEPAGHDEPHHGEVDDRVPLVGHEVVAEEREAGVVEGRNGVEDGLEQRIARRKILREAGPEQKGARALIEERGKKDEFQDGRQVPARGVKEDRLHDVVFLGGQPAAHEDEEHGRKGEDPQAPDLKQQDENDLPRNAEILFRPRSSKARSRTRPKPM